MNSFQLRTCYVNFAEHLQNVWNVNFMYEDAEGKWSEADFRAFFREIHAFGFNNFQFWIPPTLCKKTPLREKLLPKLQRLCTLCHEEGLSFNPLMAANTIGAEWFFACPNLPREREMILDFWRFYMEGLPEADIFSIFPGDPGGCNRNGCTHDTFLLLAQEIAWLLKERNPQGIAEIGTWGTPFTGWGSDMRKTEGWDGTFAMLTDPAHHSPEVPCHIWNGEPQRVSSCMKDLLRRLPDFPPDTRIAINLGFNPDAEPVGAYDARPYAKRIARKHPITSWDYAASEGELICYPHYRLPKFQRKRQEELRSAPYLGGICYTMSPKLNLLTLYAAAQIMLRPEEDTKKIAAEFTEKVFGDEKIGPLMQAFEIVPGWGYEKTPYSKKELQEMLSELILRLTQAEGKESSLPIFPSPEEYRQDLLWHARNFQSLLSEAPDRSQIRNAYRERALSIYDNIPLAVDERSILSAEGYSHIGEDL